MRRLTGCGGLATVDVADDDHVDVHLLLTVASLSAMLVLLFLDRLSTNRRWHRQIVHTP